MLYPHHWPCSLFWCMDASVENLIILTSTHIFLVKKTWVEDCKYWTVAIIKLGRCMQYKSCDTETAPLSLQKKEKKNNWSMKYAHTKGVSKKETRIHSTTAIKPDNKIQLIPFFPFSLCCARVLCMYYSSLLRSDHGGAKGGKQHLHAWFAWFSDKGLIMIDTVVIELTYMS